MENIVKYNPYEYEELEKALDKACDLIILDDQEVVDNLVCNDKCSYKEKCGGECILSLDSEIFKEELKRRLLDE